jgi:hypothetical protein
VDVEGLYEQRVAEIEAIYGEGYVEGLLAERHDSMELHHDLINHLRYILIQCRYWYEKVEVSLYRYYGKIVATGETADMYYADTSLGAYVKARNVVELSNHLTYEGTGTEVYIEKVGEVIYESVGGYWKGWQTGTYGTTIRYGLLYAKLYIGDEKEFQNLPTFGNTLFHFNYIPMYECKENDPAYPNQIWEPCTVGWGEDSIKPACDVYGTTGIYGFMATPPAYEGWYYNFSTNKWEYRVQWWIMPAEDWPPDAFFTNITGSPLYARWRKGTTVTILSSLLPSLSILELNNCLESVFEKDLTNYIEV